MINFASSIALAARINSYQNSSAARSKFDEGFQSIPVWNLFTAFDITSLERDEYNIMQREPEILTGKPEPMSCGADIPIVSGNWVREPIEFIPATHRLALEMCKLKCGPDTFERKFGEAEKEAGAGFGKVMEQLVWFGDSFNPGLTRTTGVEVLDAIGTPYENLHTQDPVEIANFFSMISYNMDNPIFYMGPVMLEVLGWRMLSSTGDSCNQVWSCVLDTLSMRRGETVAQVSARFVNMTAFDYMTGINPNAAGTSYPTLMVIDKDHMRMGASANEIITQAIHVGHDFAQTTRMMSFTSPQVRKYGSLKFVFGLVPQQVVVDRAGTRYGPSGAPTIIVPTPL